MQQRLLTLNGVQNFRDYGGYATVGGGRLNAGKLYRSAHHGRASDADLEAIGALGIAVVVDLRRTVERTRDPSRRHASFAGRVIDNDIGDSTDDPWHLFLKGSDLSEAAFRDHALGYYRVAPFEPRHIDLYSRYFLALRSGEGPVLVHCAAGKDRTGILAALTHHLMGVHRDDLVADYLLTNQALDFDRLIPAMAETMFKQTGRRPTPEAVRVAMSVEPAYLENAFSAIEAEHGSLDAYLAGPLGIDGAARRELEAQLLA
ncbi:MAG: tyrosine-protein phosphatase [Caulobacteraceae bacterium]|nr:tyrosine-protein phosphatase [Caulobacteraceae bacterium]